MRRAGSTNQTHVHHTKVCHKPAYNEPEQSDGEGEPFAEHRHRDRQRVDTVGVPQRVKLNATACSPVFSFEVFRHKVGQPERFLRFDAAPHQHGGDGVTVQRAVRNGDGRDDRVTNVRNFRAPLHVRRSSVIFMQTATWPETEESCSAATRHSSNVANCWPVEVNVSAM
jgi:hypothetical protein